MNTVNLLRTAVLVPFAGLFPLGLALLSRTNRSAPECAIQVPSDQGRARGAGRWTP